MTDQRLGLRVAGIIFAVFCLGHLIRIATHAEVVIAGYEIPIWPSWIALVVAVLLSTWMWFLSRRR